MAHAAVGAAAAAAEDAAAAINGGPCRPRWPPAAFPVRAAYACGALVHSMLLSLGVMFMLHVTNVGLALSTQEQSSSSAGWSSLRDAIILLLRHVLLPFVEASFLDQFLPEDIGIEVMGFWVPGLLSIFLLVTAWLGLSTIRSRQPSPPRAVLYALLAAVLLVAQAQVGRALVEIATWEDLALGATPNRQLRKIQQRFFEASHVSFSERLSEQKCKVIRRHDNTPSKISCSDDSLEGSVLPILVEEFCRPERDATHIDQDFDARSKRCEEQGKLLNLLPNPLTDGDEIFCRCWSAAFDSLKMLSSGLIFVWLGLLAGVLSAFFVAAQPKLARMSAAERSVALRFVVIGLTILACKVTILADSLPWDEGTSSEES